MNTTIRNVLIVLAIAAVVALVQGGVTAANVAIQAVTLAFLGTLVWFASLTYRERRVSLYALGDGRRALLLRGGGGRDAHFDRHLEAVGERRRLGGVAASARRLGLRDVRRALVRPEVLIRR